MKIFTKRLPSAEVDRLLGEGKSQSEVARILGFSKQAISFYVQRKRNLPAKVSSQPVSNIDGLQRLKRLMAPVFEEIRILNGEIKKQDISSDTRQALNFQRLKYLGEGRKLLALALDIDEKRFGFEEVLKFQNFVLEVIGEVDEDARQEIIAKLRGGKSLRRLVSEG